MPDFTVYEFVKWLHIIALSLGGGAAMVILVLVGFEDTREDLKGMTSILWRRTAAWGFRLAVVAGLALLVMRIHDGDQPFAALYLHWKLALVALLLLCSERSAKALARSQRGLPLLAFVFFLMATFVSVNHDAFGVRKPSGPAAAGQYSGSVEPGPSGN